MTARPLRILVTGSRHHRDGDAIRRGIEDVVRKYGDGPGEVVDWTRVTIVHGGQVSRDERTGELYGADHFAGVTARELGAVEERHPADWARYGRAAGPIRNAGMVARGANACAAFPLGRSPGTRDCIRRAKQACIPVIDCSVIAG